MNAMEDKIMIEQILGKMVEYKGGKRHLRLNRKSFFLIGSLDFTIFTL